MELLLVRHGESIGNAEGRMQGRRDFPLSELGRNQAAQLQGWFLRQGIGWDALYASPLLRAFQTAEIVSSANPGVEIQKEPDLAEIAAGQIEGMTEADMREQVPSFLERPVTELGNFAEYGGESYADVQARAQRLRARLEEKHRANAERVLLVGHGGLNFQLLKMLICEPVPRVCIVRMSNCAATLVRLRERRGTYIGEIAWHVPLELMGGSTRDGGDRLFR
jgi:broad specificity phosphatase PhoE